MTTCSNGPSLWKPSTKASQLFTQRNIEAAEEKKRGRGEEIERGREKGGEERNRLKKWSREEEGRGKQGDG